jgi:uncharacterized protein (DUF433 family)
MAMKHVTIDERPHEALRSLGNAGVTAEPHELRREELYQERKARFDAWKARLVRSPDILGGEPVFPGSRLAVRHVGGMVLRGAPLEEIREDYPYLSDEDVAFARLYTEAYPRVGRPHEA